MAVLLSRSGLCLAALELAEECDEEEGRGGEGQDREVKPIFSALLALCGLLCR